MRRLFTRAIADRDLHVLVDATQRDAPGDPEAALRALVTLAQREQLASRIVLQRLLSGLVAGAARYHRSFDGDDVLDHAVAAAWIAIHRYDLDRRHGPTAPALISDAISIAYRDPLRRRAAQPELAADPIGWEDLPALDDRSSLEELAAVVAEARANGVPGEHLDLVCRLVVTGSPTRLATEWSVTTRTIRNRRDRAVAEVRRAVLAAA